MEMAGKINLIFLSIILIFSCKTKTKQATQMSNLNKQLDTITLGGGCFWCIESAYNSLIGIESAKSGYMGGNTLNPTYEKVCTGTTNHAEVVQVVYDTNVISTKQILTVFFTLHDPTQLNRQGADIGTQYRSAVFYHNENQKNETENIIIELTNEKVFNDPIVTEIIPSKIFYLAEDYHQNYYNLNRTKNSYCMAVIDPKISKLRKSFSYLLKNQ